MSKTYTSIDELPVTLNADHISKILGVSRAGAYALLHSKGFPTLRIGKRMMTPKDKFIMWMNRSVGDMEANNG